MGDIEGSCNSYIEEIKMGLTFIEELSIILSGCWQPHPLMFNNVYQYVFNVYNFTECVWVILQVYDLF